MSREAMPARSTGIKKRKQDGEFNTSETYTQKVRNRVSKKRVTDTDCLNNNRESVNEEVPVTHDCSDRLSNNSVAEYNLNFKGRKKVPFIQTFKPLYQHSGNVVHFTQQYFQGQSMPCRLKHSLTRSIVDMVSDMQLCRTASPFDRRVTAMEWHPTDPNVVAVGSKGGDIIIWNTRTMNKDKFIQGMGAGGIINGLKFWPEDSSRIVSAAVDGTVTLHDVEGRDTRILKGSGGNIQAMRFWAEDYGKVLTAGLDGTVTLHDFDNRNSSVTLADTLNFYDYWYCSVDIQSRGKFVVAGDNVGKVQFLTYDGKIILDQKLHKKKVTCCEFSPREEWLLCTASTDKTVQFWDVRNIKDKKSVLYTLQHDHPINSAYFSKTDGCRLLTTDQKHQVRVYSAPEWHLEKTIHHPHRFFQHITPIKATWHPLQDLAVIGRYPDPNFPGYHDNEPRTIDLIDVEEEKVVASLDDPAAPGLVCVNKFNHLGDTLVSGMGINILLWKRKEESAEIQESLMKKFPSSGSGSRSGPASGSRRRGRPDDDDGLKKKSKKEPKTKTVKDKTQTKTKSKK